MASWIKNRMFGGGGSSSSAAAAGSESADNSPAPSAPTSPARATASATLLFAPPRPQADKASSWKLPADALGDGTEVARAIVSLYMQAPGSSTIDLKHEAVLLLLVKVRPFTYEVKVCTQERVIVAQPLVPALTFYFKPATHTLIWNMSIGDSVHALLVCFADDTEEENLKQYWTQSYMEGASQLDGSKMKEGDQLWAQRASEMAEDEWDEDMEDVVEYEAEADRYDTTNYPATTFKDFEEDDAPSSNIRRGGVAGAAAAASSSSAALHSDQNDNLAVGQLLNRTFVNRGSQLGVFKHDAHGLLQYVNNVPVVQSMDKTAFSPSKMMLYDQDNKMLLLSKQNKGTVYEMDLEYGKVVQEFDAGETVPTIRNLGQANKYAERTGEAMVLGVNDNTVFSLDPRQQGRNKLAEHKQYKTKTKFNSLATTLSGHVAVGSDDGQIRLYDSISKIAKTALPGLGDAVIGMDVTADGEYLLATTRSYLLVIPTRVAGQLKSGFQQSITNKAGTPIKLQLEPGDMVKYNIKSLQFTPAKFNTGEGQEEYISTSTGEFLITWSFTKIKQGKRFHYKIKRCESNVVADQFLFNHEDKMVVTLPDNVYMQKMQLKK